jgi:hypothetical protein
LYCSPNFVGVIKSRLKLVRHVACIGEMRISYRILVIRPEWKRPLGKLLHRWESNVKNIYIKVVISVMFLGGLDRPYFVIREEV